MTSYLDNLHFIRPWWLALLPVGISLWWLWQRSSDTLRGWRSQMDKELLRALVVGSNSQPGHSRYWLLASWVLATLAIAGPTWRLEPNPFASDAAPLLLLLKADESMQQPNPPPSRIERAHLKIADLAKARKGQPLGLIAYAGSAHLVLPPTRDTDVVAEMAAEITPDIMPVAGDRLDLAVDKAAKLLSSGGEGGTLLVIADSAAIDSETAADAASKQGRFPIQFLAIVDPQSPETKSLDSAARAMDASVQPLTPDEEDVSAMVDFAERRATSGVAGKSGRWQEAGYWITPIIAVIVALSFRKQRRISPEEQQ